MKTEQDYKDAITKRENLLKEIKSIDKNILIYKNQYKRPEFFDIKDVRAFIMWDSVEGSLFTYEDKTYEVGDYEDMENEYGYESVQDNVYIATMEDLVDGRISILTLKDK